MPNVIDTQREIEIKEKGLTLVKKDSENWFIYYIDLKTDEKWRKEYPNSTYHGGGAPQLVKIEKFPWE